MMIMGKTISGDNTQLATGKTRAEITPDRDAIRNIKNTSTQTTSSTNPICQFIVVTAPKTVATPFPPTKEKNSGRQWPKNTATTIALVHKTENSSMLATKTGRIPFDRSPAKVKIPAFRPPMRNTLVAPGLREPEFLGSVMPITLQTITAEEMDPSK